MPETTIQYGSAVYRIETYSDQDHIHRKIESTRTFYEMPVLQWIQSRRKTGVYVDVGANIGNHAIWFLNECPSSRVIAIEGNPDVTPLLRRNLENNTPAGKSIKLIETLVSCHPEVIFVPWGVDNVGMSSVKAISDAQPNEIRQATQSLDDLLKEVDHISMVKIDVEGHEFEVLRSGIKTLIRSRPDLLIECWENQQGLIEWLRTLGYIQIYGDYDGNHGFIFVGGLLSRLDRVAAKWQIKLKKRIRERWAKFLARIF